MNTVNFVDSDTAAELKVCTGCNFVGFEIDGNVVILSRAQIINDVLPVLNDIR